MNRPTATVLLGVLSFGVAEATEPCTHTQNLRASRPNLSGPVEQLDVMDGEFLIHYTMEGRDKPEGGVDEEGVPRMAHRVADALEEGRLFFGQRGYRTANLDDGQGGSTAIDVYLKEIDANGYANAIEGLDGADSCFIRIDTGLGSTGGKILESVAIHELHHCVQYAYTTETDAFMYEATATFEQYLSTEDDALDIALNVLYVERLEHPEYALATAKGRYHYAGLLFLKFLAEFSSPDLGRLPALWVALEQDSDWEDALWRESRRVWDRSFDEIFLEYSVFNAFACARDDGAHYDSGYLPCTANVEVPYTEMGQGERTLTVSLTEPRYSAGYARWIDPTVGLVPELICSAPSLPTAELRVAWHQLNASGHIVSAQSALISESGTRLVVDTPTPEGGSLLATFVSTGEEAVSATCVLEELEPEKSGCGCIHVSRTSPSISVLGLGMLGLCLAVRRRQWN